MLSMRGDTCEQKPYGATIGDKHDMEQKQYALFTILTNAPKGLLFLREALEGTRCFVLLLKQANKQNSVKKTIVLDLSYKNSELSSAWLPYLEIIRWETSDTKETIEKYVVFLNCTLLMNRGL